MLARVLCCERFSKPPTPSFPRCLLQGAGDRAFCAGGDVKTVVQLGQAGRIEEALR